MGIPSVQVNRLNLKQGEFSEVERVLLYLGQGTVNPGQITAVNTDTDLDDIFGAGDSVLKTQVNAAKVNAGQNWQAYVAQLDENNTWADVVDRAADIDTPVEGIVLTDPVENSVDVETIYAKQRTLLSEFMKPVFFIVAVRGINATAEGETWATYAAEIKKINKDILADTISLCPYLWPDTVGVYGGRLCDRSVTVADSPARVETGSLIGTFSKRPVDKDGREIDLGVLKDLANSRFTVPCWYAGYPGVYMSNGALLDADGGDYQVIENLRVVQKAMRRVYPLAVFRIKNRRLNTTPISIAQHKTYFMRPLREISKSATINGITFPGEVKPPQEGDIQIVWKTHSKVELYMVVRPYESANEIVCSIMLDLKIGE